MTRANRTPAAALFVRACVAAKLLGVDVRQVRRQVRWGQLPGRIVRSRIGCRYYVLRSALDALDFAR